MEIQFIGHSCFRLRSKKVSLVTDPFHSSVGLKLPKLSADIVAVSHNHYDHNNCSGVLGVTKREKPFVISGPGEYEISGVSIFGTASGENTIYLINMEGLRIVHLGDLDHSLDEKQLAEVDGADILFVPVGGTFTLDASGAVEVVGQIEPQVIIPMHYQLPNLKIQLDPVDNFLREVGSEKSKPLPKLVISREKIPTERQVVVLKARACG